MFFNQATKIQILLKMRNTVSIFFKIGIKTSQLKSADNLLIVAVLGKSITFVGEMIRPVFMLLVPTMALMAGL